jgi:hypothetical protein
MPNRWVSLELSLKKHVTSKIEKSKQAFKDCTTAGQKAGKAHHKS